MLINADFSRRVTVRPSEYQWSSSPVKGVERVMLDRVGTEKARATSIVRYAPGSCFSSHFHPGGEEILVLSGTFSEGDVHYSAGWYLRNPASYSHAPFSREGALIFVKLRQMSQQDQCRVRINTGDKSTWQHQDDRDVCPLFAGTHEQVCLQRLKPNAFVFTELEGGAELLVLCGEIILDGKSYEQGSWIRIPVGDVPDAFAGQSGAEIYLKIGHLTAEI